MVLCLKVQQLFKTRKIVLTRILFSKADFTKRNHYCQSERLSVEKTLFASPYLVNGSIISEKTGIEQWTIMRHNELFTGYLKLSKFNLTALVGLTAAGGYVMSASNLSWSFASCIVGTMLLSASANSVNQLLESPYDAQMKRTNSRLLVVNRFTPLRACAFGLSCGVAGALTILVGCNLVTACLGLLNVFLYVGVYTPLKRHRMLCTWVGALVGAIPPLMGYTAAGNMSLPALVVGAVVYCWQFPHFNGLSWGLRGDYSRAGYRVMCVVNERLCKASSLRNAFALTPICSIAAPLSGLTSWTFAVESLPLNLYFAYLAFKFYCSADSKSSRSLFLYSLLYLPLIFISMYISKIDKVLNC